MTDMDTYDVTVLGPNIPRSVNPRALWDLVYALDGPSGVVVTDDVGVDGIHATFIVEANSDDQAWALAHSTARTAWCEAMGVEPGESLGIEIVWLQNRSEPVSKADLTEGTVTEYGD